MTKLRLSYVKAYVDRHGKARHYFRRPGFKSVPLPGKPGSEEFMAAYQAALKGETAPARQIGLERTKAGSFSALIVAYYGSAEFKGLQPITQKTYRSAIERFRSTKAPNGTIYGDLSVSDLQSKHIMRIMDGMADKPGAAYNLRRVLRILMRFAVERGWRNDNPTLGVRKVKNSSTGYRSWTEEDIAKFEAYWPPESRARLALALLLYTAQRRADVVTMGRQHIKDGKIHVAQSKSLGHTKLAIPLHPKLKEAIDAVPASNMTFLMTEYGKPMSPVGFSNWFSDCAKKAGLPPQSSPHGLRKAASRRLAEAGCTAKQIQAITGHKSLVEVATYTAAADQVRLAEDALEALQRAEKGTPSV